MSHIRRVVIALTCVASLLSVACGDGGTAPSGATGIVTGKITAADGKTAIAGVLVSRVSSASPSATTDVAGAFTLSGLPSGSQTLQAKKGNFSATFTVTVKEGDTVNAPTATLLPIGKLAFVPGAFDSIESIVGTQLGNSMDQLSATQLSSAATLNGYRMIFLNCGLDESPLNSPATAQALKTWVEGGGVLYASDYALSYVRAILPGDIGEPDFLTDVETITATVTDTPLQTFVGKSSVQIRYDLPGWQALKTVSSRGRVLLRGSYHSAGLSGTTVVNNAPLSVVFTQGSGKVIYTTFHNEAGATADQVAVLKFYVYID